MSASPDGGRLGRYVWKMKAAFKGTPPNTAESTVSAPAPAPSMGTKGIHVVSYSAAHDPKPILTTSTASLPISIPSRERNSYARALALAAKYNIDLEPFEWPTRQATPRVEKPVRMRVHRICHMCQTAFGSQKICATCKHARCHDCARQPHRHRQGSGGEEGSSRSAPRSSRHRDDEDDGSRVSLAEMLSASVDSRRYDGADVALKRKYRYMLTKPGVNGGQDLVRKKPVQRVRRTCHCCETTFQPNAKACPSCGHTRCGECPRDPAKRHKYPDGYPSDASPSLSSPPEPRFLPHAPSYPSSMVSSTASAPGSARVYRRPRPPRKIHYTCDRCKTPFLYTSSHPRCGSCGHERCNACERVVVLPLREDEPAPSSQKATTDNNKLMHVEMPQVDETAADEPRLDRVQVDTTKFALSPPDLAPLDRLRSIVDVREQRRMSAARVVEWRPAAEAAASSSTVTTMMVARPGVTPPRQEVVRDVFEMALEVDVEASAVEM